MGPNRQNTHSQEVKVSQHVGFGEEQSFSAGFDFDWKTQICSCCFCLPCVIRYVTVSLFSLIEDNCLLLVFAVYKSVYEDSLVTDCLHKAYNQLPPFIMSIYVLCSTC